MITSSSFLKEYSTLELLKEVNKRLSKKSNVNNDSTKGVLFTLTSFEDIVQAKRMVEQSGDTPYALLVTGSALVKLYSIGQYASLGSHGTYEHPGWHRGFSVNVFGIPIYDIR